MVTGGPRPLPRAQGAPPHPGASAGAAEARWSDVDRPQARCEGELAWLVYIIATVLGSHLTPNSNSETQQLVDGDLTCAVLQLLPLLDSPEYVRERSGEQSNVQLDLAVLFFLQQFRKVYVGDQATSSSKARSPHISPDLQAAEQAATSPHISPHLPTSPHICPGGDTGRHLSHSGRAARRRRGRSAWLAASPLV